MMNSTILQAIQEQKNLELRYHGYSRLVEPHAYGRGKGGDEVLRCYQIAGGSDSGEQVGWKLLKVGEIHSLHLTDNNFSIRPEYRRNDKAMTQIFCQI